MKISLPAFLGYRDRAKAAPAPSDCLPTSADGPITSSRISACPTTSLILNPSLRQPPSVATPGALLLLFAIFRRLADSVLTPCLAVAATRDTLRLLPELRPCGQSLTCPGTPGREPAPHYVGISATSIDSSTRPVPSVFRQRARERPGIRLASTSLGPPV